MNSYKETSKEEGQTLETSDTGTVQHIVQLSAMAMLANMRLLMLRLTLGFRMKASRMST